MEKAQDVRVLTKFKRHNFIKLCRMDLKHILSLPSDIVKMITEYYKSYNFLKELSDVLSRRKIGYWSRTSVDDGEVLVIDDVNNYFEEHIFRHRWNNSRSQYAVVNNSFVPGYYFCRTCVYWHFVYPNKRGGCKPIIHDKSHWHDGYGE